MSTPEHRGYCGQMREEEKVPDSVQCCGSCHTDNEEYGYSLSTWTSDDDSVEYDVCCILANWMPDSKQEPNK